jgi:hypothetical protein
VISLATFELAGQPACQDRTEGQRCKFVGGILATVRPERSRCLQTLMRWRRLLLCLALPAVVAAQTNSRPPSPCAQCHGQGRSQPATSMAHALETVEECKILIDHPLLAATVGKYSYRIERKGDQSSYSVSDGVKTLTMPIRWVMGTSSGFGQTYLLEKDGELYESRVSYFREPNGLDLTIGYQGTTPADLTEAAGRLTSHDERVRCFGCHGTNAVQGKQLTLDKMTPGVQCAHCHESVGAHLAAMQSDNADQEPPMLFKLRGLTAERAANFCGQCHRTWEEIALQKNPTIANIRFQPYRLTQSKCYDPDDARIGCLACHDPHREVSDKLPEYDAKCTACHGGGKVGAKVCKVSTDKCVTCHMPKLDLPGAHHKFTDHRIRIVKPNEKYPG